MSVPMQAILLRYNNAMEKETLGNGGTSFE